MTAHLRWGIVGASKFARTQMAPALHLAKRGALTALATSSRDKAEDFRRIFPNLNVHATYESLLDDPEVDALYVPLPNHLHVDWALRALDAGKHVLVEKPLAMSASEFDRVIAARDNTGLLAAEAYMIVHHPQWQTTRRLLQDGAIGTLQRVSGAFSYDNSGDPGNIRNIAATGGGAIPDIGVYIYGATRFVTGEEPEQILSTEIHWENGVDVWSHVTAKFPSFHYSGVVSMRMAPWQDMTFHGSEGVLRLTAPFNPQVYGPARIELHQFGQDGFGPTVTEHRFPDANHYVLQAEAFNKSALDGTPFKCPLEFSRGTQVMIDQVFAKARS
ncbi:MAG: Gfo/Idh/MocA family oxidoreductase [Rhodobacteraceae bacterium]|nr:Gfo/Idh/MocA family oxidoreductase [Paracoccaceae bacterium]